MKKINYRQYYYDGKYGDIELQVPDECRIYKIGPINISHLVKDAGNDIWTKAYALLCPTEFEDSTLLGNVYFNYISDIFITNSEISILDVKYVPLFSGVYSVEYYKNREAELRVFDYINKIENIEDSDLEEVERMIEECNKISSISMLRKITYNGIEVSSIHFRDRVYGKYMTSMSISNMEFGEIFVREFTTDKDVAKLFLEESEKAYKSIINNE